MFSFCIAENQTTADLFILPDSERFDIAAHKRVIGKPAELVNPAGANSDGGGIYQHIFDRGGTICYTVGVAPYGWLQ